MTPMNMKKAISKTRLLLALMAAWPCCSRRRHSLPLPASPARPST